MQAAKAAHAFLCHFLVIRGEQRCGNTTVAFPMCKEASSERILVVSRHSALKTGENFVAGGRELYSEAAAPPAHNQGGERREL